MTALGGPYIRLGINLSPEDRDQLAQLLQARGGYYSRGLFRGQHLHFDIVVDDGSVKIRDIVYGVLAAIIAYGEFRHGVDYTIDDARTFSERVLHDFEASGVSKGEVERFERRLGVPGQISRVLARIDYLQRVGRDLSSADYKRELSQTRRELIRIFRRLDVPEDQALVRSAVEKELPEALPPSDPMPLDWLESPVAIQPRAPAAPSLGLEIEGRRRRVGKPRARHLRLKVLPSGEFRLI